LRFRKWEEPSSIFTETDFILSSTALNCISNKVLIVFISYKFYWSGNWNKWKLQERLGDAIYLPGHKHRQQWKCSPNWETVKPGWYAWGSGMLATERELSSLLSPLLWTRTASGVRREKDLSTWSS
jgi:hypothetical protein